MDFLRSNSMVMMEKSMGFLWTKQAAILDNISNVDTPNYKAKVVTFEKDLINKLEGAASSSKKSKQTVRQVLEDSDFAVYDIDEAKRMDDNGVDATEQMVEMVRNAYQQQYLYNAINKNYSILRMAVRGQ